MSEAPSAAGDVRTVIMHSHISDPVYGGPLAGLRQGPSGELQSTDVPVVQFDCPHCMTSERLITRHFDQYFSAGAATCESCGRDADLFTVMDDVMQEGTSQAHPLGLAGANARVIHFTIEPGVPITLRLSEYGVPSTASRLGMGVAGSFRFAGDQTFDKNNVVSCDPVWENRAFPMREIGDQVTLLAKVTRVGDPKDTEVPSLGILTLYWFDRTRMSAPSTYLWRRDGRYMPVCFPTPLYGLILRWRLRFETWQTLPFRDALPRRPLNRSTV